MLVCLSCKTGFVSDSHKNSNEKLLLLLEFAVEIVPISNVYRSYLPINGIAIIFIS